MRRGRPPYPGLLTPREQQVLDLIREGMTNEQIAERLGISFSGARYHVAEILSKLGVNSRQEAALWIPSPEPTGARRFGLLSGLFGRIASSMLARAAGSLAIAAGLGLLLALLLGVIEMGERRQEQPLPSIEIEWAEVDLPPLGEEPARPFFTAVEPDGQDLWRVYVARGSQAPVQLEQSRRYPQDLFWSSADLVTLSYLASRDGAAALPNGPLVTGLSQYSLAAGKEIWQKGYQPGSYVMKASPDGSEVAIVDRTNGRLYIQQLGGSAQELRGAPGSDPVFLGWSADGSAFALQVTTVRGHRDTRPQFAWYLAVPGHSKAFVLGGVPSWSPEGSKLAIGQGQDLLIVDAKAGTAKRMAVGLPLQSPSGPSPLNWSGAYITRGDALIDTESGRVLYQTSGRAVLGSTVSADGRWQAFTVDRTRDPACGEALAAAEMRLRDISTGAESTALDCRNPWLPSVKWLKNGKLIANGANCQSCGPQSYRVGLVETSTGELQPLTDGLEVAARYQVSPDGQRILVTGNRLRVYSIDGVLEREIVPPDGLPVLAAAWSPDGSSFAYIVGPRIDFT
jgi:DNA-binding CsgD family transcriptional regulator